MREEQAARLDRGSDRAFRLTTAHEIGARRGSDHLCVDYSGKRERGTVTLGGYGTLPEAFRRWYRPSGTRWAMRTER